MKNMLRILSLGAMAFGTLHSASATAIITGSISYSGTTTAYGPTGVTYSPSTAFFFNSQLTGPVQFQAVEGSVSNFTAAGTSAVGGEEVFNVTNSAGGVNYGLTFFATSSVYDPHGQDDTDMTGNLYEYQYSGMFNGATCGATLATACLIADNLNATVDLTDVTNTGVSSATSVLAASPASAPEPNSLVLLGTGMMSAAGMMIRRRRSA